MENRFCSLAASNVDFTEGDFCTFKGFKESEKHGASHWGDIDLFCKKYGLYQENSIEELLCMSKDSELHNTDRDENILAGLNSRYLSAPEVKDAQTGNQMDSSNSVELLNSPQRQLKSLFVNKNKEVIEELSTEQILRAAGERLVQFSSQKFINIDIFRYPYRSSLSSLSFKDKQDVELAQLLLGAAEKVGYHQYDIATRLIKNCQWIASTTGTPVQRTVHYFAEALLERIKKETECVSPEEKDLLDFSCVNRNILAFVALHQELPHTQVVHFTAVQTILEYVAGKQKVHLIDFEITTGLLWAGFMQSIAEQATDPRLHLKITAVETNDKLRAEKTGKMLKAFTRNMNFSFSYKVVFLSDMKDLKEDDFKIERDEAVAVYAPFMLRNLIAKPMCLMNLMTVLKKISPSVIVVSEVEANHNSPSFFNRFVEALFYYGALFDSLEEGMASNNINRMQIENETYSEGIRNIVAKEGYERVTRSMSIRIWRAFFARFGLTELELSSATIYQACLILNQFPSGKSCTLDISSKCLLVGWKGTPFYSISAWKFH